MARFQVLVPNVNVNHVVMQNKNILANTYMYILKYCFVSIFPHFSTIYATEWHMIEKRFVYKRPNPTMKVNEKT